MLKLSITFASLIELQAFVSKMGDSVLPGEIQVNEPITAPKEKATRSRGKKDTAGETAPAIPSTPTTPIIPFPAPTNLMPGNTPVVAPAQPAHPQNAPIIQPPVAPASAPVAPVAPVKSTEHQQYENAVIELVQTIGKVPNLTSQHMDIIMSRAFAKTGIQGTKITEMSIDQIKAFYPIFHADVSAVCNGSYNYN
jgi:hypothetical protein